MRRKIINKKNIDKLFSFMLIFAVILLIELGIFYVKNALGRAISTAANAIFIITNILFILGMLIAFVLKGVYFIEEAISHVSRYKGAECFEKIEFLYKNLGECNGYYQSIIREIKQVYKVDSEVQKMADVGDLDSLYARKSYLENGMDFHSNMMQIFTSLGISFIVAFANFTADKGIFLAFCYLILIVVGVLLCCVAKYIEKGRGDSYLYNIYEYELGLLNEKINSAYNNIQANEDIEKIIHMRQTVINALVDLYKSRKKRRKTGLKKKDILNMAQELYKLPLIQDINRDDMIWGKMKIHGIDGYFPIIVEDKQCKCLSQNFERVHEIITIINI